MIMMLFRNFLNYQIKSIQIYLSIIKFYLLNSLDFKGSDKDKEIKQLSQNKLSN